jgi:hypothetical protein
LLICLLNLYSHYTDTPKYYSAPSYYTTKATEYYMTRHAAPSYYTEAPKYYLVLGYLLHRHSFYYTKTVEYYTEATQPELRRPIITQSRLTTQKLLFRTTLNRNITLMLQSTTPRPTLHLATTPQPPSTTYPQGLKRWVRVRKSRIKGGKR